MKNRELIDKLQSYLLEYSTPETTARACAGLMVDIHRIATFKNLPASERESLRKRIMINAEMLEGFAKHGCNKEFWLNTETFDSDKMSEED